MSIRHAKKPTVRERFASSGVTVFLVKHVSKRGKTYWRKRKQFPAGKEKAA